MLHFKSKNKYKLCLDLYVIRDKNCIGHCCSEPYSLLNKLDVASEAGFEFVEIWHKDVLEFSKKYTIEPIIKKLQELNIKIASMKVLNNWFLNDNSTELINLASQIGSEIIVTKLIPDEYSGKKIELNHCIERYNDLLKICEQKNVKPAIEFMALAKYMNKIDDVYEILKKTSGNNKCLVLDTWHLWRNDDFKFTKFMNSIMNMDISWAGIVHFTDAAKNIPREMQKDGDRRMPNNGCLNLSHFSQIINNLGFSGYYSLNVYDQNLWNYDKLNVAVNGRYQMMDSIENFDNLKDSQNWSKKQQHRCDGLWAKSYRTHLDPRIKKTMRDTFLQEKLEKYLKNKYVLDFKCGFSPLVQFVSEGFDASSECISFLKKKYPHKKWHAVSDSEFSKNYDKKIDVLLHIGLGDSITEEKSHMIIKEKCKPEIIVIECAADANKEVDESLPGNRARWARLKENLIVLEEFDYKTNMDDRFYRKLIVGRVKSF